MNIVSILFKLWPAIRDTFFGGINLTAYLKRNKTVAMLSFTVAITTGSYLYMYEQAFMHGSISKAKTHQILELRKEVKNLKAKA